MSIQVTVQVAGTIKLFFSNTHFTLNLKNQATLKDLYMEIGNKYGDQLSESVWNHKKNKFRGPVVVSSQGDVLRKEQTVLRDDQCIKISRFLIGG